MTDFKPTYRAKREVLEAETARTEAWFMDHIREAFLKRPNLTDEDRAEFMANGIDYRHRIERTSTGYGYSLRVIEHSDYFHIFRIKESHSSWKDIRIVIRKNGTINIEKVVDAAISQVWGRQREKRQNNIEATNRAEWDVAYNLSPHEYEKKRLIRISLSKTQVGCLEVFLRDYRWGFETKKTIRIQDLEGFRFWAEAMRDGMNKWTENAKEKN